METLLRAETAIWIAASVVAAAWAAFKLWHGGSTLHRKLKNNATLAKLRSLQNERRRRSESAFRQERIRRLLENRARD